MVRREDQEASEEDKVKVWFPTNYSRNMRRSLCISDGQKFLTLVIDSEEDFCSVKWIGQLKNAPK